MEINDAQTAAMEFILPNSANLDYLALGLAGESGEVANLVKKIKRGDYSGNRNVNNMLINEMGDVFWYLFALCTYLDVDADVVIRRNLNKLSARKEQNTLNDTESR